MIFMTRYRELGGKIIDTRFEVAASFQCCWVCRQVLVEILELGRLLLDILGNHDCLVNHVDNFLEVVLNKASESES